MPISEYPEVVPPTVVVRASYPGANPKTISETVAAPLEQAINGVENSLYMFSQATSDGVMTLTITFKLGTDLDNAQVQVQNRVAQALPKLPEEVRRLGVTTQKASPDLTHGRAPLLAGWPLRRHLRPQLRDAPGEGRARRASPASAIVRVFGSGDYAMRVWLDPEQGRARKGLTASDVVTAIREQNVQVAAGARRPAARLASPTDTELLINTKGRLTTEEEFGDIIVKTGAQRRDACSCATSRASNSAPPNTRCARC